MPVKIGYSMLTLVFLTGHAEQEYVRRVKGITRYGYVIKKSGEFVLLEAISMAAELFQRELMVLERNKELRTLLEVSKINLEQQDVEQTLQKTTDSIVKLLDFNSSALYLVEDSDTLRLMAATPPLPPDSRILSGPPGWRTTSISPGLLIQGRPSTYRTRRRKILPTRRLLSSGTGICARFSTCPSISTTAPSEY
jgi:hypothetical protein